MSRSSHECGLTPNYNQADTCHTYRLNAASMLIAVPRRLWVLASWPGHIPWDLVVELHHPSSSPSNRPSAPGRPYPYTDVCFSPAPGSDPKTHPRQQTVNGENRPYGDPRVGPVSGERSIASQIERRVLRQLRELGAL